MSWQKRFGSRPLSQLAIAVTLTLVAQAASAQLVGSRSVQATGCGIAAAGDVRDSTITTVCGMPPEQVVELVRLAASPQAGDRAELMVRVRALIPASSQLRVEAISKFFQLLGEAPVEESRLADRFAQIAEEHRRLVEDVKSLRVNDPEVQALRQQAVAALEIGDHATASAKYEQARAIVTTKRETLARVLDDQKREEAALVFEQARVELARLAYEQAADLFAEAARLLPAGDTKTRWQYIMEKADAEQTMGDERGNNSALVRAIESCRVGLALALRTERPHDWAMTQVSLGNALRTLGAREGGTARLEEAVAAYRDALKEWTRERVPLRWAMTQHNLGTALRTLSERESGTARLEEALAAYRDALKETTRERVPLDWAMSFGDEGVALMLLAERRRDAAMAKTALDQINTAFETMRDGGHAPSAAYYEQQLPRARALVARLRGQRR
jgi:tetratricopeptide (TPR) repeat protein